MRTPIFHLDAFTTRRFAGNPAAVMPMDRFPTDAVTQSIAAENNLSETAFLVPDGGNYSLRWFTPATEVPLCGHATLASAAVVMERLEPGRRGVVFHTASGLLTVNRVGTSYVMDFPVRPSEPVCTPPGLAEALAGCGKSHSTVKYFMTSESSNGVCAVKTSSKQTSSAICRRSSEFGETTLCVAYER